MTLVEPEELAAKTSHYDIFDHEQQRLKWDLFEYARNRCPVTRTDGNGGFWLVTRHEDVLRVMHDWRTFSSKESTILPTGMSLCPIDEDPPVQVAARQLLGPYFSRRAVMKYEPMMRETARGLIAGFIDRGEFEVYADYSGPLVGKVLTTVVFSNMPEQELDLARDIAVQIAEGGTPEAYGQLFALCERFLERVRRDGADEDTFVSRMLDADFDGRPITRQEQLGMIGILLLGGLDTTRTAIGNIIYRITQSPEIEDRLRNPEWVRRDLDELLRLDTPVGGMARLVTKDVELGGVLLKAGDRVQVRFDSANRDERVFHNPDRLTFDEPRPGHLAFGMGVHRCIGSNLARLQIEIAFQELLAKVKNFSLHSDGEPVWIPGQTNTLDAVRVAFERV